jgi:hypothetical protein
MLLLERIELIADEDGDGHRGPPDTGCAHSVPILRRDASADTVVSTAVAESCRCLELEMRHGFILKFP